MDVYNIHSLVPVSKFEYQSFRDRHGYAQQLNLKARRSLTKKKLALTLVLL